MSVEERLASLDGLFSADLSKVDNAYRRWLYSTVELLRIDLEEEGKDGNDVCERLDALLKRIPLVPLGRGDGWVGAWRIVWELEWMYRAVGVISGWMVFGLVGPVVILPVTYIDKLLTAAGVLTMNNQLTLPSTYTESTSHEYFDSKCTILTFTHSSNLDGFIATAVCPIPLLALAKKELFLVPFFSWISYAIGGIPVDRGNRTRAVNSLTRAVNTATTRGKVALVIAPEGTRSTTGQLLPFKKGAFHMWDDTRGPIVPVVTMGAFDIYPTNTFVNRTGRIFVRVLPPILPKEASDRSSMQRLVRRRILECLMEAPVSSNDGSIELTWMERIAQMTYTTCMIGVNMAMMKGIGYGLFTHLQLSVLQAMGLVTCGSIVITMVLYVYHVYIIEYL